LPAKTTAIPGLTDGSGMTLATQTKFSLSKMDTTTQAVTQHRKFMKAAATATTSSMKATMTASPVWAPGL